MMSRLSTVTYKKFGIVAFAAIVLGVIIALVPSGMVRTLAIIAITLIAFVLQGTIISDNNTSIDQTDDKD
ncbi:hypothetical protein MH117_07235 [Paenibacillus sp. ACRRX]|uniref:hypothetical protein n=1 Tax=unclassified Paenibacillus TaxID=185978 RepID=UPI001EF67B01|nr:MULTISPECIES: hypothetical protein [unclassified Paenibacillus]MCG7407207.1 hypothetical protein [Paenibacillus sp. ACRRX]MDK8180427.1 hypothetical protein [Paenibacillus sp. UMB4589-SE434]